MKYENRPKTTNSIYFFWENDFAISLTLVYLGVQPSSTQMKGWNNEYQIWGIDRESQGPFLLPRFQWWCSNYKVEENVFCLGSWSSILNSEAASGLHYCNQEFAYPSLCTIQADNCRVLQEPQRKHNFARLRQVGTTQISPRAML